MKLAKMSIVAALLLSANAYAIENVKVSGDAKLFYSTDDSTNTTTTKGGLFEQTSSAGQAAVNIGLTADLLENVSTGVAMTGLSSLGLHNNLVSGVWEDQVDLNGGDYWFSEAWMATTMGKTTAKVGRQTLDTPLAFTETWSIAENTFDAAVLINQDLPDTTLIGTYIGSTNQGGNSFGSVSGAVAGGDAGATRYSNLGAYAFGAVNNSMKELTLQAWYYNVISAADALWLSADLDMSGILAGVQYSKLDNTSGDDGDMMALMLGYAMKDVATFKVAYSTTDDKVGAGTNFAGAQTKAYTEVWWNYGRVASADTDSILLSAEATVANIDLYAGYAMIDHGTGSAFATDLNELAISASKSYGPLDTSVVFINTDEGVAGAAGGDAENMLQLYLTLNF